MTNAFPQSLEAPLLAYATGNVNAGTAVRDSLDDAVREGSSFRELFGVVKAVSESINPGDAEQMYEKEVGDCPGILGSVLATKYNDPNKLIYGCGNDFEEGFAYLGAGVTLENAAEIGIEAPFAFMGAQISVNHMSVWGERALQDSSVSGHKIWVSGNNAGRRMQVDSKDYGFADSSVSFIGNYAGVEAKVGEPGIERAWFYGDHAGRKAKVQNAFFAEFYGSFAGDGAHVPMNTYVRSSALRVRDGKVIASTAGIQALKMLRNLVTPDADI